VTDGPLSHQSYDPRYFALLFQVEDRHFWFRARNQVIATVVKRLTADLPRGYRVLEIGCGTGNVLRVLERVCTNGTVVGMDPFWEGLSYARHRADTLLVQGDVGALPFGIPFDLIGLFDVLEHLPDDDQVLHNLHDMLAERGNLLLTVPAHPSLWSYFDEVSRHRRRYKPAELASKLIHTGYRVEYLTHYMVGIFPLVWLGRRLATLIDRRLTSDTYHAHDRASRDLHITPVVNELLAWLLAQEARVIAHRWRLPIGASLLAIGRKE